MALFKVNQRIKEGMERDRGSGRIILQRKGPTQSIQWLGGDSFFVSAVFDEPGLLCQNAITAVNAPSDLTNFRIACSLLYSALYPSAGVSSINFAASSIWERAASKLQGLPRRSSWQIRAFTVPRLLVLARKRPRSSARFSAGRSGCCKYVSILRIETFKSSSSLSRQSMVDIYSPPFNFIPVYRP